MMANQTSTRFSQDPEVGGEMDLEPGVRGQSAGARAGWDGSAMQADYSDEYLPRDPDPTAPCCGYVREVPSQGPSVPVSPCGARERGSHGNGLV
jgi:hypothetical protein